MILIALKDLYNPAEYGRVKAGSHFEAKRNTTEQLIRQGSARSAVAPTVLYETKVVAPEAPEVSARQPFRNGALPDLQPPAVAPESDSVLRSADVPAPRVADRGKRQPSRGRGK